MKRLALLVLATGCIASLPETALDGGRAADGGDVAPCLDSARDCDGDPANGCEMDLLPQQNCGRCGSVCTGTCSGDVCSSGWWQRYSVEPGRHIYFTGLWVGAQGRIAVGDEFGVLASRDGFNFSYVLDGAVWLDCGFGDGELFVMEMSSQLVRHSPDLGESWENLSSAPIVGRCWGRDATEVFAVNGSGLLLSRDHGLTWQAVVGTLGMRAGAITDDGRLTVVTTPNDEPSAVQSTSVDALDWSLWTRESSAETLYDVAVTPAGDAWVVGAKGTILHSRDGVSWERVTSPTNYDLKFVSASRDRDEVFITTYAQAWSSTDSGAHWQAIDLPNVIAVARSPTGEVWAIGYDGIFRFMGQ